MGQIIKPHLDIEQYAEFQDENQIDFRTFNEKGFKTSAAAEGAKMKPFITLFILLFVANVYADPECPHSRDFMTQGWIVHNENEFQQILAERLDEFLPEIGTDLVLEYAESYISDYSHNYYLIMWVVIWDRVSTAKDEMWGDVAFSRTCPYTGEYTEVRWYDPVTKKKHIVFNPDHSCCLTTSVPLAYNTIF